MMPLFCKFIKGFGIKSAASRLLSALSHHEGGFWRWEYLYGFKPAPYLRLEFHSETSERGFTFANQLLGAVKGGCLGGGKAHIITT